MPRKGKGAKTQSKQAAPGQDFGKAAEQERAMEAVPLPRMVPEPIPLDAPSQRPQEPVQAGLPSGPGPGPEIIESFIRRNNFARQDLSSLAPYLPGLEVMAEQPDASITTRNFVRRVRGAMPPEEM